MKFCSFYQLLLVLLDRDRAAIYLERLPVMNAAIWRDRPTKSLNREKLGEEALFAFDEANRSLAVCSSSKL